MNKLLWSLIILDAVVVFGLVIGLSLSRGKSGPNVLDSLAGPVAAGLSILLAAVSLVYWNSPPL